MKPICSRLRLLAFAAIGCAVLATLASAPAQNQPEPPKSSAPVSRARPIPTVDFHIPWMGQKIFGMHAESNKPVLGRPTVPPEDRRYFYLPLCCFVKKGTGELDVTVTDDGAITLPMIFDSEEARKAVRSYLVEQKLIPADAMDGHVQTVAAKVWYLETAPGYEPKVRFGPYENFHFSYKGQLLTRVSPDHAQKFVSDLKSGQATMQMTIVFEGYSYQDNSVVISADDILSSDQYRKLHGPGSEGKVGRHQVAKIAREACIVRNVAITTEYHDPDFSNLVNTIVRNYAEQESRPMVDWNKVEAFFKEVGWDPNDFKADLIEASKYNENKEARDQFSSDISKNFDIKASGGFGPFSASASFQHSSNEKIVKDVFSKWGLNTEWQGKKYIPKSIDVFAMNTAKIRQQGTFAVGNRKKTVSDGVLTVQLNSRDNVLHTSATPVHEEQLAEIARQVKAFQSGVPGHRVGYAELTLPIHNGDQLKDWIARSVPSSINASRPVHLDVPNLPANGKAIAVWITHIDWLQDLTNSFNYIAASIDGNGRTFHYDIRSRDNQPPGRGLLRFHFLYLY